MNDTHATADRALASLDLEEATLLYQAMIDDDPADYDAWLGLARTLTKKRRTDEAVKAAGQCTSLDPSRWEGHAALGTLSFLVDENDRAIAQLERAIVADATAPEPHLTLSQVYAEKEEFEQAQSALIKGQILIAEMADGTEKRAMEAFALHVKTYLLLSRGDDEAAFETAQQVIAYGEDNPHAVCLAYSTLGILSWRNGEMDQAQEYLENAHELNPFFSRSAAALGQLYYMRQKYTEAAEMLGHAVAMDERTEGATHYAYGTALAKTGRRQEAQLQFRMAVEQGLKGLPGLLARWQVVWQSTVGRTLVIMLGLALVAVWLIWGKPDASSFTLLAAFGVFLLVRRVFPKKNRRR